MENMTETILRTRMLGPNRVKLHQVDDSPHNKVVVESAPTIEAMPHLDAVMVRRRKHGAVGKSNPLWHYPEQRAPGVYPQSIPAPAMGNNGGGVAGLGTGYKDATFDYPLDLAYTQEIATSERHMLPHFVKPEHYQYVDKTRQTMEERMIDEAEDMQRERIKMLKARGFTEEEITKKLDEEKMKALDRAIKEPYNPKALMEARLAQALPTQMREDYPNTSAAPGDIPAPKDMSAYARATMSGNAMQRSKKLAAMRHEQYLEKEVEKVEPPLPKKGPKHHRELISEVFKTQDAGEVMEEKMEKEKIARQEKLEKHEMSQESVLGAVLEKSIPTLAPQERKAVIQKAQKERQMVKATSEIPDIRGHHMQTSLADFLPGLK